MKRNSKKQNKKAATEKNAKAERDALGGRVGSRCSAINQVIIKAGKKGATAAEVIAATGEKPDVVSAQLADHIRYGRPVTRKQVSNEAGRKVWRYFLKPTRPAENRTQTA